MLSLAQALGLQESGLRCLGSGGGGYKYGPPCAPGWWGVKLGPLRREWKDLHTLPQQDEA